MKKIKETWTADKASAGTKEAFWVSNLGRIRRKMYKPYYNLMGELRMKFDRYVFEDETD